MVEVPLLIMLVWSYRIENVKVPKMRANTIVIIIKKVSFSFRSYSLNTAITIRSITVTRATMLT